jgi:alpha-mannosidase
MEKPVGSPLNVSVGSEGDKVTVPIHPFEILSIRADYPHASMEAQSK